jgi:hypothetical protein
MKKSDNCIFYKNYEWEKPRYSCFWDRCSAWYTKEEAISINFKSKKKLKTKATQLWRTCTKCKIHKTRSFFWKRTWVETWHRSSCLACDKIYNDKYRTQDRVREKRNLKEKIRRETIAKDYYLIDQLYYNDPIIKNNRKILKNFKQRNKNWKEIKISKFHFIKNNWWFMKKYWWNDLYLLWILNLKKTDVYI